MGLPRFLCGDLADVTYGGTYDNALYPMVNLKNYNPDSPWMSTSTVNGQVLTMVFATVRLRDFCVIDGHNLGAMVSVVLEAADDAGFTTGKVTAVWNVAGSSSRLLVTFQGINKRYWRLNFVNTNGVTPQIGQVFIDQAFTVPDAYDLPWKPANEAHTTTRKISQTGILRATQPFAGRVEREFKFTVRSTQFRQDFLWFHQRVRGGGRPFYFWDTDDQSYYTFFQVDANLLEVKNIGVNELAKVTLIAVSVATNPMPQLLRPMSLVTNGSTKYASKATPVGIDVHGPERCQNGTFETDVSNWVGTGSHSIARVTGAGNFHSGAAGGQITNSSGAGSYANSVYMVEAFGSIQSNSDTTRRKFMIDFWAKSVSGSTALHIGGWVSALDVTLTGSWAHYVGIYTLPYGATGDTLYWWLAAAGVCIIDDVSVTECLDYSVIFWVKGLQQSGDYKRIVSYFNGGITPFDIQTDLASGYRIGMQIHDGITQKYLYLNNTTMNGLWHLGVLSVNRTGNALMFMDAVQCDSAAMAGLGKLVPAAGGNLLIGCTNGPSNYFNGAIGEAQVVIGYALTQADAAWMLTRGIPRGWSDKASLARVVCHFKWRGGTDADFLKDEAGYCNLAGTNVTIADQLGADISYPLATPFPIQELFN